MSNVVTLSQNGRIVGIWKHVDGFSDVEFTFSLDDGQLSVSVVDTADGETPEIYDVRWNESQLEISFAALWSSGRLVKYRASVGPNKDRLQATITSTWQELWERQ
jgi:hypothetical protein